MGHKRLRTTDLWLSCHKRNTHTSNKPKETIKQRAIRFSHKSLHGLRQNFIPTSTQRNVILSCRLSNPSTKPS